jgi:hypothetical protein
MNTSTEKSDQKLMLDGDRKIGPVLIVGGMHRSGTSFVSSILKEAGLHVGERLSPGEAGNTKGFFENTDFVHLHARILKHFGFNAWSLERIESLPDELLKEVHEAVKTNAQPGAWGWKDPRTTLFLDLWLKLLPDAKYLFVYRAPWEVVDSLFRRGDKAFQDDPILALKVWEHYNRLSLDFYNAHRDRCLLAHVDAVTDDPAPLVVALRDRLGLPLTVPSTTTFDETMLRKEPKKSGRPALIRTCFPEIYKLWLSLEETADLKRKGVLQESVGEKVSSDVSPEFAEQVFSDWMEMRKAQLELSRAEKTLDAVRTDLEQSNARINWIEQSRIWKIRGKLTAIRELLSK